jgi:hypothetical protein
MSQSTISRNSPDVLVSTAITDMSSSRTPHVIQRIDQAAVGFARIGAGVAESAKNAAQGPAGNAAMPFSASVGMSRNSAARFEPVMPIASSSPKRMAPSERYWPP